MSTKSHSLGGVRTVAVLEGVKGFFVLIVGFGLLSMINHDVGAHAEWLVRHLHLNPANKYPRIFLQTAHHVTDLHLWMFATLAMCDAVLRAVMAWGLWNDHRWAKWLGVVGAGIYMPIEIYELFLHVTVLKLVTFITNLVIVIYLGSLLYFEKKNSNETTEPA